MKIWSFVNYAMLPEHAPMNRHYYFAKNLAALGHAATVFAGSHPHNTSLQLITDGSLYKTWVNEPFRWVYVKTCNYAGSRVRQVWSMFEFYRNSLRTAKALAKTESAPDVILGSSAHPLCALLAIRLGKKFRAKSIVEIRDLWPESIVAYGLLKRGNPIVRLLYRFERYLYTKADAVVFTMEGGADYIRDRGWDAQHGGTIDLKKVHHINNGVDLELFDRNRSEYPYADTALDEPDTFKVVYTGSIRRVNALGTVLDAAKLVKNEKIRFLIYGEGNERAVLEQRAKDEGIGNVVFRGAVERKYLPSIVCRADLNFAHNSPSPLFCYGISFNKIFDYFAAGKPILSDFPCPYNPIVQQSAGWNTDASPEAIARAVEAFAAQDASALAAYGVAARAAAQKQYDFRILTKKLIDVVESIPEKRN